MFLFALRCVDRGIFQLILFVHKSIHTSMFKLALHAEKKHTALFHLNYIKV